MSKPLRVPTVSDWAFHRLFGDERNIESLQEFLQAILDMPDSELAGIQLLNPYLAQESVEDKYGILDVKLQTAEGKIINVEIQVAQSDHFFHRILYYTSKMIFQQLSKGDDYGMIKKVISITILDHMLIDNTCRYHHIFKLQDGREGVYFGDILEVHTLELPKLPAKADGTELWDWLSFFRSEDESALEAVAQGNEGVAKVVGAYKELTADERAFEQYEAREKARMDQLYYENQAKRAKKRLEEEMKCLEITAKRAEEEAKRAEEEAERAEEEAKRAEEEAKRAEVAIAEASCAEQKARLDVAKNALAMGLDICAVAKMTGLTVEEVEPLSTVA